jgi:hypothetical protein
MNRSWVATTAVLFLGLTFLDDVLPEDLGLGRLSNLIDGTVASSEAPTKATACEQATQTAVEKTSLEHRSEITSKTCSCNQRASSVETWTCVASVRWTKSE